MTQPIIRGRYERFASGILAFTLGWALMAAAIYLQTIIELIGGLLWWSFASGILL